MGVFIDGLFDCRLKNSVSCWMEFYCNVWLNVIVVFGFLWS